MSESETDVRGAPLECSHEPTALEELRELVHETGKRVPWFCSPVPSREVWNRIETLIEQIEEGT